MGGHPRRAHLSCDSGKVGAGEFRADAALAISATMLATLAVGLVGVGREPPLLRLVAGAASLFLALMFSLSFVDIMTRLR